MKTYKALDNSLHCIDPNFTHMLPAGCIEITDTEATAIRSAQQAALPIQIPQKVTMRQAQEALLDDGTLDLVEATLAAMPGIAGKRARIQWAKSAEVRRDWPLVIQLGPIIGKTPEQLDQLFITAATL